MKILSRHFLGDHAYIAYPHSNCFVDGGKELIHARGTTAKATLYKLDMASRESRPLLEMGPAAPNETAIWYDVALKKNRIAGIFDNRAWYFDFDAPGLKWTEVYAPAEGNRIQGLPSITADGSKLLCGEYRAGSHVAVEIDLETGKARELFSHAWHANHFHYCPHDESWIAFSHEGPTETTPDRCWMWHETLAPEGKQAFDQKSEVPGKFLYVGHERMSFHDVSGYVIAYAVSPAGKRGLYEYFADNRPARLLWESDVMWHCSMDPSGRFAVIDTTGPWDGRGLPAEEIQKAVEAHVKADAQRLPNSSEVVLLDLEKHTDLSLGTVMRTRHPYHPHPAISPDTRWIAYTDAGSQGTPGFWLLAIDTEAK